MIAQRYRPTYFREVAGNDLPKQLLQQVIRKPETSPRTFILSGGYGTGKTSISRIFARGLNCEKFTKDLCGECYNCKLPADAMPFYQEYDSSSINVASVRELRDTFYYNIYRMKKVIVFDEAHLISRQAQSALLKVIEENELNVYFLFITTDPTKVLDTIHSRSLYLEFATLPLQEVMDNLKFIIDSEGVELKEKTLAIIAKQSSGHMRNAHLLLDQCLLLGEQEFLAQSKDPKMDIIKLLRAIPAADKGAYIDQINILMGYPLARLQIEFREVLLDLVRASVGLRKESVLVETVNNLGPTLFVLISQFFSEWVRSSMFSDDLSFQLVCLTIYQTRAPQPVQKVNLRSDELHRTAQRR